MNILIAEDDMVSSRVLQTILKEWGYGVVVTKNGKEALNALERDDAPPLAILDWMMPGMSGVEVCRRVRQSGNAHYTYILMLTARNETADVVDAMEAGADDFVSKPFDEQELRVRVRAGERIIKLEETLRFQATHDVMTGIFNHGMIVDILQRELVRAGREEKHFGIIMGDLDHFKKVNDTYGHLAGDEVLQETARRVLGALRPYDSLGRYGGEEFLVILPGCDARDAMEVAERIRSHVAGYPIDTASGSIPVTISLGVAVPHLAGESRCIDANTLIRIADEALYRAKQNGRNRCEPASEILVEGICMQ